MKYLKKDKILSTISLCKRAAKLVVGFDVVKEACEKKQVQLVVVANDVSPKTLKEITFVTQKNEIIQMQIDVTMDEIWFHISKRAGVIGIADKGFAEKIKSLNNTIMEGN